MPGVDTQAPSRYDTGMDFDTWRKQVDTEALVGTSELPDTNYPLMWESGFTPREAAEVALRTPYGEDAEW